MQILLSVEQIECVYIDEVQLTMKGNKPPITLESVRDECAPSPSLILELEMDLKLASLEMPKWRNVAIEKRQRSQWVSVLVGT